MCILLVVVLESLREKGGRPKEVPLEVSIAEMECSAYTWWNIAMHIRMEP